MLGIDRALASASWRSGYAADCKSGDLLC